MPNILRKFILVLILTAPFVLLPASAQNGNRPDAGQDIELLNGKLITVTIRGITEEGLVLIHKGQSLQIYWSELRAERFLEERKDLLNVADASSLLSFAAWCKDAGLKKEWDETNRNYKFATGKNLPTNVSMDTKPDPVPLPIVGKGVKIVCSDAGLKTLLRQALKDEEVEVVKNNPAFVLIVKGLRFKFVDGAEFWDALVFVEYAASCSVELKEIGKGSKSIDLSSGNKESDESKEAAIQLCREALNERILIWLKPKLEE